MPPVATGLILLKSSAAAAPIGGFFTSTLGSTSSSPGGRCVIAMAVMSFPLLVRSARVAFEGVIPA